MPALTRRHVLISAAATAAVAAMPAALAITAVEVAPDLAGWAFVVNDCTRPLLARLPFDITDHDGPGLAAELLEESYEASLLTGPHRWAAANIVDGEMRVVGNETWSRRQALIDAGHQLETL